MIDPFLTDAPQRTPGADFEALPYSSHPFPDTRPGHLAMIAKILGFDAPELSRARVLELGCASGGNIIPMAARTPQGQFLGVDLSRRHVELAQERIAALGLSNVEVRQGDLGEDGLIEGEWDFIICHGVFSWVSPEVQAQILKTIQACLSEKGLAYISYNVMPGWSQRNVVRDIFLFDDDPRQDAKDRVARGRWLLDQLSQSTEEQSTYGRMLRSEAAMLEKQADNYIMAEFLVDENLPCYFHDFASRAGAAGLSFLGETRLTLNALEAMNPQLDAKLRTLAGPSRTMYEHYYDFVTGRAFRQSILFRSVPNANYKRKLDAAPLTAMHFASNLTSVPHETETGAWHVRGSDGVGFTSNDPAVVECFAMMARVYPATCSPRQIMEHLASVPDLDQTKLSERIMQALMRTTMAGLTQPHAEAVHCGSGKAERPALWPVALQELRSGKDWVTSQAHKPVRLDKPATRMASLFDGTHVQAEIEAEVAKVLETEADSLGLLGAHTTTPESVAQFTQQILRQYAALGLLVPD